MDQINQPNENAQLLTIKPPQFSETSVTGWFPIIEAQFRLRNIVNPQTKFYTVLAALPPDIVTKLPNSVLESEDYDVIKESIVSTYEKTKPEMLEKLMKNTTISGRPSLYLTEMMTLGKKIGCSDDIVRHNFLKSVPPSLVPVLASQEEIPLAQLGRLADKLLPFMTKSNPMPVNEVKSNENNSQTKKNVGQNQTHIGIRPFSTDQKPKVCRGHIYFADKSRTCKPWCRWPNKNGCSIQPNSRPASPARSSSPSEN